MYFLVLLLAGTNFQLELDKDSEAFNLSALL